MSDHSDEIIESSDIGDVSEVEVRASGGAKGPDPEEWGSQEERLAYDIERGKITESDLVSEKIAEKLANGEDPIVTKEDGTVVKGPDSSVWTIPDDETDQD